MSTEGIAEIQSARDEIQTFHAENQHHDFLGAKLQYQTEQMPFHDWLNNSFEELNKCADTIKQIFEKPIQVAFLGGYSSGKSALLNALIAALAPDVKPPRLSGARSIDTKITILDYGEEAPPRPTDNEKIEVQSLPVELLREVNFIDTPGLGSGSTLDQLVYQFVSECDFIFYCYHPKKAEHEENWILLREKFNRIPLVDMRYVITCPQEGIIQDLSVAQKFHPDTWQELLTESEEIKRWLYDNDRTCRSKLGDVMPPNAYDLFTLERCFFAETRADCGIKELLACILDEVQPEKQRLKNARLGDKKRDFHKFKSAYNEYWRRVLERTTKKTSEIRQRWQKSSSEILDQAELVSGEFQDRIKN